MVGDTLPLLLAPHTRGKTCPLQPARHRVRAVLSNNNKSADRRLAQEERIFAQEKVSRNISRNFLEKFLYGRSILKNFL